MNLNQIINREIWSLHEIGSFTGIRYDDDLADSNYGNIVRDGGYAGWALQPDSELVGEDENTKKLNTDDLRADNIKVEQEDTNNILNQNNIIKQPLKEIIQGGGYLAYHGSDNKIDKFTDEYAGKEEATDQEGPGIYFTTKFEDARGYGEYVHIVRLSPRKLLDESDHNDIPRDQIVNLIKNSSDWETQAQNWSEDPESGVEIAVDSIFEYAENEKDLFQQIWYDFFRNDPLTYVREMVRLGYDGQIIDKSNDVKHLIIYNPNIIEIRDIEHNVVENITVNEIDKSPRQYKNISGKILKGIVSFIEGINEVGIELQNKRDITFKIYRICYDNLKDALRYAKNDAKFFNNLIKVQKFLKSVDLIKEDLLYWHVNGDANDDNYKIGGESLNEDVSGFDRSISDHIANNIASQWGFSNVNFLDSGTFGYAYDLGHNMILKITTDKSEAVENLKIKNKDPKTLAKIYGVYEINYNDKKYYAIHLEKLKTDYDKFFRYIDEIDKIFRNNLDGKGYVDIIDIYVSDNHIYKKDYAEHIKYLLDDIELNKFFYGILNIVDELSDYGVMSLDFVNSKNLGYKNDGTLGFFDLGFGDLEFGKEKPQKLAVAEDGTSLYTTKHGTVNPDDIDMGLQERVKSWMPKAQSVEVKKKCRLGGKGDGTSVACNQGDITNLEIKPIKDELSSKENTANVAEDEHYFVNEEYLRQFKSNDEIFDIYRNPKSIVRLKDDIRGIITPDGDLYIIDDNWSVTHDMFSEWLNLIGYPIPKYVIDNLDQYVPVVRFGKSNKFYLSESYREGDVGANIDNILKIFNKAKGKNPTIEFIPEIVTDVTNENSKINESDKSKKLEYGCLMLDVNVPNWKNITDKIKKEDIYNKEGYGIEHEPHITLHYGFHDNVTADDVFDLLKSKTTLKPITIELNGISIFEGEEFDVVKFDVTNDDLIRYNEYVKELPYTSDFPVYHPHMTIGYVKPGEGKKYVTKFTNSIKLTGNELIFSDKDENKEIIDLKNTEILKENEILSFNIEKHK